MQWNPPQDQLDEIWKTTSIFFQMEDYLNFFQMQDYLNFVLGNLRSRFFVCNLILTQLNVIWKTTSIFLKMEDDLNFWKIEDDHNFLKMEDDLIILVKGRLKTIIKKIPETLKIKTMVVALLQVT